MGGSDSKIQTGQLYDEQNYTFIKQIDDERYGLIKILEANQNLPDHQNMKVCVMNKTINTEEEYDSRVKHALGRKDLKHPSLVQFFNYSAEKSEEFCSTFWKVSSLYEYVNQDLQQQLQIRHQIGQQNLNAEDPNIQNQHYFTEGQMWYLLRASVDGLQYLKGQDIIHGDIRPTQILLTDDGRVKLGEQFAQQESLSGYQQLLMEQRKDQFYIAPAVFETLKDRSVSVGFDVAANDVFSLGLTLLEAGILKDADECYNTDDFTFRCDQLQAFIAELRGRYSEQFCNIIARMLIENDVERPTMEQVHRDIEQYCSEELFRRQVPDRVVMYIIGQAPVEPVQQQQVVVEEVRKEVVEEPREEVEEQVVRAARVQEPVQAQAPVEDLVEVVQTNVTVPQVSGYDMRDIDDKINKVLAMSRDTVRQYGGEKAYQAYESYNRSASPVQQQQATVVTSNYVETLNRSPQQAQKITSNVVRVSEQKVISAEKAGESLLEKVESTNLNENNNGTYTMQFNPTTNYTNTYQANAPQVVSQVERKVEQVVEQKPVEQQVVSEQTYVVSSQAQPYRYQPAAENTTVTKTYQSYQQNNQNYEPIPPPSNRVISGNVSTPQAAATTNTVTYSGSYQPTTTVVQQGKATADDLDQQIQRSLARSKQLEENINSSKRYIGDNVQQTYQSYQQSQ